MTLPERCNLVGNQLAKGTFVQIRKKKSLPLLGIILYQGTELDFILLPFDWILLCWIQLAHLIPTYQIRKGLIWESSLV